jgi:hypothetical protein
MDSFGHHAGTAFAPDVPAPVTNLPAQAEMPAILYRAAPRSPRLGKGYGPSARLTILANTRPHYPAVPGPIH